MGLETSHIGASKLHREELELPFYNDDLKNGHPGRPRLLRWKHFLLGLATFVPWLVLLHVCRRNYPYILDSRYNLHRNPAFLIEATHGAVAAENKRCSDIGVAILKEGGNAIDAAIAATLCIGVVHMFSSGIGGGGFMTVRIPASDIEVRSRVYTLDFRETAPALANSSMFIHNPVLAKQGGLSIAVPGEIRGLEEAHRRWGKLPWERLFRPNVQLAKGWEVDTELSKRIMRYADLLLDNSDWSAIFAPNGVLLREGDFIQRTNLARTLATIATAGPTAFYKGPIADSLVRKVRANGGILSNGDLENYIVKVDRALEGRYRGKKVYTTHAPTSGPVLLHMFNLFGRYNITRFDALTVHRMVEIMKFGFAARTKICDPRYINDTTQINAIPTVEFADLIAPNITDGRTHPPEYYRPEYDIVTDHGTSHISVVDKDGMAVALTSTVNLGFGSRVLDPETGIILNDEMDDFSTPGVANAFGLWPSPYNYPEPGKRPLSSMAPTIIENPDGSLFTAIGGSGGSRIFGSIFQVVLNLELGMDVSAAIEFGRVHDQLYPLQLEIEDIYPPAVIKQLQEIGHNVTVFSTERVESVIQAVARDGGKIFAASDSRKNGIAAGY